MKHPLRTVLTLLSAVVVILALAAAGPIKSEQEKSEPIVPKEKTLLWNGKDFTGWLLYCEDPNADRSQTWTIKDGVIHCTGQPYGYMRTLSDYKDYLLHVEWRWPEELTRMNSGAFVHMHLPDKILPKSLECQMKSGEAGYFWMLGGTTSKEHAAQGIRSSNVGKPEWYKNGVAPLREASENPIGQWNTYQIICKDDWVMLMVNGVLQNLATKTSVTSGKICLQSEGAPIEFRNIWLEPLDIQ